MYQQIEELRSRGGEKVALFLTAANMGGMMICVLPMFLLTVDAPVVVRIALLLLAAFTGYSVTLEVRGLALYERLLWSGRGVLRRRVQHGRITPDMFPGTMTRVFAEQPIIIGGPITIVHTSKHRRERL